ncbi:hypothetical protein [Natrinema salaciae]|uniref:hypothetical protein n=1 Tax=Natrinema salaciae TaxID=1186196 RepID=UPI001587B5C9
MLLLEANDKTVGETVIGRKQLLDDGRHVDAVLSIEHGDDEVVTITYDTDRQWTVQKRSTSDSTTAPGGYHHQKTTQTRPARTFVGERTPPFTARRLLL